MIKAIKKTKTTAICPDCGKQHRIHRVSQGEYIKGCTYPRCVYWVEEPKAETRALPGSAGVPRKTIGNYSVKGMGEAENRASTEEERRSKMGKTKGICGVCGQPIHKSKVKGWGWLWLHSIMGNHDHIPILKKESKEE